MCSSDCHDCCLGWILCFILSSYNMGQRFFLYLEFWKEPPMWLLHMDYHNCCLECCTEQLQYGSANISGNFWALEIKNFTIIIFMIMFNFWRSIFCDFLACCLLWSIQSSGSQYYSWLLLGLWTQMCHLIDNPLSFWTSQISLTSRRISQISQTSWISLTFKGPKGLNLLLQAWVRKTFLILVSLKN